MKMLRLSPVFYTENLEESLRFYTSRLGFTLEGKSEENGWALLSRDEVEIMFSRPNAHVLLKNRYLPGHSIFVQTRLMSCGAS